MDALSEKERYDTIFERCTIHANSSIFFGAEDFLDRKLAVYPQNINQIPDYDVIRSRLVSASLILSASLRKDCKSYIAGRYDPTKRIMYIAEDDLAKCWASLRQGVLNAIQLAHSKRYNCLISRPEDILELSNLQEKKKKAYLNDTEKKKEKTMSDEEILFRNKKQSLLDNPKMLYYYSENAGNYHDKSCIYIGQINPYRFRASEKAPEGKTECPRCRKQLYLRIACFPNTKQMSVCDRFLKDAGINDGGLKRFVIYGGLKFHASDFNALKVTGKEDQWIIEKTEDGGWRLMHNNYVKTMEKERYITEGFHDQGMYGFSMFELLKYIQNYTWEGHLQAKEKKQQRLAMQKQYEEKADDVQREIEQPAKLLQESQTAAAETVKQDKEKWYRRIGHWISRFFSP